jgi:protein-disulfide isomerase
VVFRHFPLDHSCNPLIKAYMHAFSCQAARAAEAARELGGDEAFWKMHDALFAHASELDTRPYAKLAEEIGLDPERLLKEMAKPEVSARITSHVESSKAFKISSTPSVFLNGRRVRRGDAMPFWEAILSKSTSQPASRAATSRAATSRPADVKAR